MGEIFRVELLRSASGDQVASAEVEADDFGEAERVALAMADGYDWHQNNDPTPVTTVTLIERVDP